MAKKRERASGNTLIQNSRNVSPQQKAVFHNVVGAGRSKVRREFFNLGPSDAEAIVNLLETRLDANLQRGAV
jgi:hypothetical protein